MYGDLNRRLPVSEGVGSPEERGVTKADHLLVLGCFMTACTRASFGS